MISDLGALQVAPSRSKLRALLDPDVKPGYEGRSVSRKQLHSFGDAADSKEEDGDADDASDGDDADSEDDAGKEASPSGEGEDDELSETYGDVEEDEDDEAATAPDVAALRRGARVRAARIFFRARSDLL